MRKLTPEEKIISAEKNKAYKKAHRKARLSIPEVRAHKKEYDKAYDASHKEEESARIKNSLETIK